MATYHCSVKKGKCLYANSHAEYILREGKYSNERSGREDLVYKESGNMPKWADTARTFWQAADDYERINGVAYFEFEVALPNELSQEENIKLVQKFVKENIGDSKPYTFAIHEKTAALDDNKKQPHAHIMFSERIVDEHDRPAKIFFRRYNGRNPERGGARKDTRFTSMSGRTHVCRVRKNLENLINKAYKENNLDIEVSADSLRKQYEKAVKEKDYIKAETFDREPEVHLGPKLAGKIKRESKKYKNKEDYFKVAGKKACQAFYARQAKEALAEYEKLKKEAQKLLEIEKAVYAEVNKNKDYMVNNDIKVVGRQLAETIEYQIQFLRQEHQRCFAMRKELKKDILNENRLKQYVISVYTKGYSQKLKAEYNNILRIEKEYNDEYEQWKTIKPGNLDFIGRYKHRQQEERLNKWKADLIERKDKCLNNIEMVKMELEKPEAKEVIDNMIAAAKIKMDIRQQRYDRLTQHINTIKNQIVLLKGMKWDVSKSLYASVIKIDRDTYEKMQQKPKEVAVPNMIENIRNIIKNAEATKNAHFSGKHFLSKSLDEKKDYEL